MVCANIAAKLPDGLPCGLAHSKRTPPRSFTVAVSGDCTHVCQLVASVRHLVFLTLSFSSPQSTHMSAHCRYVTRRSRTVQVAVKHYDYTSAEFPEKREKTLHLEGPCKPCCKTHFGIAWFLMSKSDTRSPLAFGEACLLVTA